MARIRKGAVRPTLILASALVVIFLSSLLDYGVEQMRVLARESFRMTPYLWSVVAANLLVAFMLLVLGWLAFRIHGERRAVGGVLLLFGLLIVAYPLLFFQLRLGLPPVFTRILTPAGARMNLSAAFVTVLGTFLLFCPA